MDVITSLIRAIDRAGGDALVMHVGEKPYVVTASGHAELAAKPLTSQAMLGMLDQVLPAEVRLTLDEVGAVEHFVSADAAEPDVRYSIVAARGGDDIWIEVRRRPIETAEPEPEPGPAIVGSAPVVQTIAPASPEPAERPGGPPTLHAKAEAGSHHRNTAESEATPEPEPVPVRESPAVEMLEAEEEISLEPLLAPEPPEESAPRAVGGEPLDATRGMPAAPVAPAVDVPARRADETAAVQEPVFVEYALSDEADRFELVSGDFDTVEEPEPAPVVPAPPAEPPPPPRPALVVPMNRGFGAPEPPSRPQARLDPLQRLLQVAAAQGASALYVAAQSKPSIRVGGEMRVLDEEPLTEAQLESALLTLLPKGENARPSLEEMQACYVPEIGRVQVLGFRDHRGLGAMFRMVPPQAISAEHLGLSSHIHALCTEPEGLLLVAGVRRSGKSTLVTSLVDQMNATRRDRIITVERHIHFTHENRHAVVSQREPRNELELASFVRAAMREAPDVLVIDDVASADVARVALLAASEGHLVVAALTSPTIAAVLERFVGFFAADDRAQARVTLADHLRGVVSQVLLRKTGGGRAAAREVLVNVPAVASLIADAQFDQLAAAMNTGRRVGMVPLNDSLLALVREGSLDVREAHRKSPDPGELLQLLKRAGMDTSFAERLA